MHDIVIRGGTIVDGTGAAAFSGDVAIDGEQIVQRMVERGLAPAEFRGDRRHGSARGEPLKAGAAFFQG